MPFFSQNGHFEALENAAVQFKEKKINLCFVPKVATARVSVLPHG